jgi:peptidoglycan/xylan/chitin deacetylase (PgdA/CDA1 family)
MKPVLMIHEVGEALFDLPLEDYILTFDDGLYSQYHYWPKIKQLNTTKYFFISSDIYCRTQAQSLDFPTCVEAHVKARQGNYEDYMTVDQILELGQDPQVIIGGHGHKHVDLSKVNGLQNRINIIVEDTDQMIYWFQKNLKFFPYSFCFPYNNNADQVYTAVLKQRGFTDFFGQDRIPANY